MKATILVDHPFLIPDGTKMNLTLTDPKVECGPVFFAGYRLLGKEIIRDSFDLFARFKKPAKDGTMSNRNIDLFAGVLGRSELARCEIEILELPNNYQIFSPDPDKYNDLVSGLVAVCTREMLATAHRKGISELRFKDHPDVDKPFATFNADDPVTGCSVDVRLAVTSIEFFDDEIVIRTNDENFSGNLDGEYGEGFDVAEALPHIYRAFVEAVCSVEN